MRQLGATHSTCRGSGACWGHDSRRSTMYIHTYTQHAYTTYTSVYLHIHCTYAHQYILHVYTTHTRTYTHIRIQINIYTQIPAPPLGSPQIPPLAHCTHQISGAGARLPGRLGEAARAAAREGAPPQTPAHSEACSRSGETEHEAACRGSLACEHGHCRLHAMLHRQAVPGDFQRLHVDTQHVHLAQRNAKDATHHHHV